MMKRSLLGILFIIVLLLSACSVFSPVTLAPMQTYAISYQPHIKGRAARSGATLLVNDPLVAPDLQSTKMLYLKVPFAVESYAYNEWAAPPGQMLQTLFVQCLRHRGLFRAVVAAPFGGNTTYRLDTQLITFQQEFLQPTSQFHMVLQATLVDVRSNDIIGSKIFDVYVPAPQNNPYSGVVAANEAVAKVCYQIYKFCAGLIAHKR